ncbi:MULTISPECIES: hypothetical protein [unclassified Neisseria]|uniref:hypothetical protein n=1 Tax=unclassified Neisseria TaxID=2623750 RepID=UPI0008A88DAB|nr:MULTISPECIES: hypothetical protein [unclassified Neisseria]OHP65393.1 hypothetical protein HMPREF2675_04625 [Neisseria sp. HMSC061H08]OHQ13225.1 hypothetical protein HMPREF2557_08600 [Neisseria sp. HMSC064F03]
MLGWWISVFSDADRQEPHLIASWECGVSGVDWLDELCKEGRAAQTENKGGYPDVYQTQVRHVFPWLLDGKISPQDDAPNGNFTPVFMEDDKGKTVLMKSYGYRSLKLHHPELLRTLPLEAVLTIQVFDLS